MEALSILFAVAMAILIAIVLKTVYNLVTDDARKRGKPPLAVFLLVLCSFPFGLVIWLVFRPDPIPRNLPTRRAGINPAW